MAMSLYHEIHVTLKPDFDRIERAKELAGRFGYHMGNLVLLKGGQTETFQGDMFFTSRESTHEYAVDSVTEFVSALKNNGFIPIRYKIEDTTVDSRVNDTLGLL